jgi:hypothetical protein
VFNIHFVGLSVAILCSYLLLSVPDPLTQHFFDLCYNIAFAHCLFHGYSVQVESVTVFIF